MKLKRCRLTEKQQGRLLEFFVGEMTARTAADLAGINKTTAAYFYHRLREIIAWRLDQASPLAGESFDWRRERANAVVDAAGKVPVFGIEGLYDDRCQLGDPDTSDIGPIASI